VAGDAVGGRGGVRSRQPLIVHFRSTLLDSRMLTEMPMRLIGLVVVLTLSLFLAPFVAEPQQQAGKTYKIGILWAGREPPVPPSLGVFGQSLADSGYVEGKNLSFLHRWSEVDARFPDLAAELVHLKVDVLVATASPAIRAAVGATTTIPVVVLSAGDPVEAGLITSLSRPGGNVTGVSARAEELSAKLLELLKESIPRSSRFAVMGGITVRLQRKEMEVAARSLRIQLQFIELTSPTEVDAAFETVAKARPDGLVLLPTLMFAMNPGPIAKLALQHRLPAIFWGHQFPAAGGLMAYGPDVTYLWQRAGVLVAKILKGSRPADLPVEQADRFRLVINLNTAKALGLTIPQSVLLRADQVIE